MLRCITVAFLFGSVAAARRSMTIFPQRSNDDSALLEWGHSAVIHAADAVVAAFGLQAHEEEFDLGIEASPVFASPSQGCEPLRNADDLRSQMVFMFSGACDFETKAKHAVQAGAVALVVINHDQSRPDHAFAMARSSVAPGSEQATADDVSWNTQIPCVMVSWNSGQAILEDRPERLRLYPGGGRPFIESVSDDSPVVFLIHNLLSEEECTFLKESAKGVLRPSTPADDDVWVKQRPVERSFNSATLHHGIWKSAHHKAIDEKLFSIINFPSEYFADLQINEFVEGGTHGPHYDSDKLPSVYRERVMTVVFCLNTVAQDDGGGLVFPKAGLRVQPQAGMAIVYHNTVEDGSLDMTSLHSHERLLNGSKWTATQRIHAAPLPLAGRTVIPALIMLSGGHTPQWMFWYRDWTMDTFGVDRGFELFNQSFLALVALVVLLIFAALYLLLRRTPKKNTAKKNR